MKPFRNMPKSNIKYLIIPDLHGRAFWREPVMETLEKTAAKIVFLGDFHDPYHKEFSDGDDYLHGLEISRRP